VACLSHKDWSKTADKRAVAIYLSTMFLANRARVNPKRSSLAYSATLGVRVPDYEVERKLWPDRHFEGGYLFRDALVIELVPPKNDGEDWNVKFDWQSDKLGQASQPMPVQKLKAGKVELEIPFNSDTTPGIRGKLRFVVSGWN